MTPSTNLNDKRSDHRRTQILAAAAHCFRQHGFHGAGIAKICDTAEMSPGNLYNYFDNKESIIAAIVARELERTLASAAELRQTRDDPAGLAEHIAQIAQRYLEPDTAALNVEIAAEAARNPHIAEIVREADARARASIASLVHDTFRSSANRDDEKALSATVEMIVLILDGLRIRCIRNPGIDRDMVARLASDMIRSVLSSR